jgi:hypothetical protein
MTFIVPETAEEIDQFQKLLAKGRALAHQKFLESDTLQKKKELWFSGLRSSLPTEDRRELGRILTEAGILKKSAS